MAVIEDGTSAGQANVDSTGGGLHVTGVPREVAGAYVAGGISGVLPAALASGSAIWSIRNGPTGNTKRIYMTKLFVRYFVRTVASAFTDWTLELERFTGANMTTGTALEAFERRPGALTTDSAATPSGPEAGDLRIASTAALGVTSVVYDGLSVPLLHCGIVSATVPAAGASDWREMEWDDSQAHPCELGPGDGLAIRTVGATPTGFTANVQVRAEWNER